MKVSKTVSINSNPNDVWNALADWGSIVNYHPWVVNSPLLSSEKSGVGASRRCEFADKTSIVETVTKWQEYERMEITLSDTPFPLKSGTVAMVIKKFGSGTSVTFEMDIAIGMGPLGWIMGPLAIKPLMKTRIEKMLQSLEHYLKTGTKLDPKGNIVQLKPSERDRIALNSAKAPTPDGHPS